MPMSDIKPTPDDIERHRAILQKQINPLVFPSDEAPSPVDEIRFLEGPQEIKSDQSILDTVNVEFSKSFAVFNEISPCVAFFGSAIAFFGSAMTFFVLGTVFSAGLGPMVLDLSLDKNTKSTSFMLKLKIPRRSA